MKRQRNYVLTVQGQTAVHVIKYPLTLQVDVQRNVLASANTARLVVYNLSKQLRQDIFQDRYDTPTYRAVKLNAGYQSSPSLPTVFRGNMWSCGYRRPGVDWLSEINAFDGGYAMTAPQAQVDLSVPAGWSLPTVLRAIVGTMPGVAPGAIGADDVTNSRGINVSGNSWEQVQRLCGNAYTFIDNERVNVLAEDQYVQLAGAVLVIEADSGLLGTPRRQNRMVEVDLIFEPAAVVGAIVLLRSADPTVSGYYTVRGIHHRGTISGAVDGGLTTTLTLFKGITAITGVPQVVQEALS